MGREIRSEFMQVMVTPSDRRAIEAAARRAEMSNSEYLRTAALLMLLADADKHAVKALGKGLLNLVSELVDVVAKQKEKAA